MEQAYFSEPWPVHAFKECMKNDSYFAYVAVNKQEEVLGFSVLRKVLDVGEVMNVAVREDKRRQGVGRKLIETMIEAAKAWGIVELQLEVRESNEGARKLYEKMGFMQNGLRKDYYQKPTENAVLMTKILQLTSC